jgi:hypothetical protein
MKLPFEKHAAPVCQTGRTNLTGPTLARRGERGMAVIVVIAFLAILFVYIAANIRALDHLNRELKFIEQKQTRRLAQPEPKTNSVAVMPNPVEQP